MIISIGRTLTALGPIIVVLAAIQVVRGVRRRKAAPDIAPWAFIMLAGISDGIVICGQNTMAAQVLGTAAKVGLLTVGAWEFIVWWRRGPDGTR